ncbi:hypothetical protein MVES_000436 [Malassezia vespertilionis]|uniref:GCF C-terminal domain-containing protein n=1 Tax=Malassezia vespertilionis TaxID=2020962 RepID=A0A2N1JFR8_9BASI|nr:hypothetical protein MVES_000436 [Malassezia vespertilionis]
MTERARDALLQRYGDQSSHTKIVGPDAIAATKKKRAELRRLAALASRESDEEDFIPLQASTSRAVTSTARQEVVEYKAGHRGPHPESGLQREEDELGSGEEEHAEYTGATERIPLGREEERRRKQERRKEMRRLIDVANGAPDEDDDITIVVREKRQPNVVQKPSNTHTTIHESQADAFEPVDMETETIMVTEEDPDERAEQEAWEAAQLSRMDMPGLRQAPREPINALEKHIAEQEQRQADADSALDKLDAEEDNLKETIVLAETKNAWFTEFNTFVSSLAEFLEVKMPLLETLEHNALSLLTDRTASRQRAHALVMEDCIALFHGVSSASIWPARLSGDGSVRPTDTDGPWDANVRMARRAPLPIEDTSDARLSPAELAEFVRGREALAENTAHLLADTNAPEFQDPAAKDADHTWLAGSLVARFDAWRNQFPDEYDMAWGGLALANAWEFWARYELAAWDPLWCTDPACQVEPHEARLYGPPAGLEGFVFEQASTEYVEASATDRGGDAEISATLVSSAMIPRLIAIASQGIYDPWSTKETEAALVLMEQATYVLDASSPRLQSLAQAFLQSFKEHVHALHTVLNTAPTMPGPSLHPDVVPARMFVLEETVRLAQNLAQWSLYWVGPHALPWSKSDRVVYETLAETTASIVCLLAAHLGSHGVAMVRVLLSNTPRALLQTSAWSMLDAFVLQPQ